MVSDTHNPGRGSRECVVCAEPWPCTEVRQLAAQWEGLAGWRPEWLAS
ncbi:hypothetical protein ATK74_0797 [Propionicimonas paludicola]|uniref:Uncharacterized protein n=2 Tax=Propionicimonas paludicola TaxID=185243 RepID=A0A2A9CPD8_9ACTN|nr:hypothetical protein ATK74_0797 [Propionicimonas paludicola]